MQAMQPMQGMPNMQNMQQRNGQPGAAPDNITNITMFLQAQYVRLHRPQPGTWQAEVQVAERIGLANEL